RSRLTGLTVDVVASAGTYVDVLPAGVNKGTTLRRVVMWLGRSESEVVVAGVTLNDLALFEAGFAGAVVGNSEPGLRAWAGGRAGGGGRGGGRSAERPGPVGGGVRGRGGGQQRAGAACGGGGAAGGLRGGGPWGGRDPRGARPLRVDRRGGDPWRVSSLCCRTGSRTRRSRPRTG